MASLAFGAWLFAPPHMAPGMAGHDAQTQWYPWRAFAFDEIRDGRLPLWNPYILCGTPFLGNFQSAMFYPPNLIFLVPDVALAARVSLLFHLWLSLLFTYLLARLLRCGRAGAAVAAIVFTFCAAQWLRIPAGHWGVSTAIPWLPLVLFCIEWQFRRPGRWPVIAGGLAVGMQALAGVPQYLFISAIAAGLYALLRGIMDCGMRIAECGMQDGGAQACPERSRTGPSALDVVAVESQIRNQKSEIADRSVSVSPPALSAVEGCLRGGHPLLVGWGGFVLMYLLGAAIAAVQLLPGLEAAANGARSLPMKKEWIELFSLAPENLLTMFVPGIFGGTGGSPYWGRFYFWEMNAYVGIVALALVVAAFLLVKPRRKTLIFGIPALILLLLAMGRHTPLMGLVGAILPFSEMFRGSSKFLMPFSLMLALLAGMGAQEIIEAEVRTRKKLYIPLALSVVTGGAIAYLLYALPSLFQLVINSGESFNSASGSFDLAQEAVFRAATMSLLVVLPVLSLMIFKARSAGRKVAILALVALDLFVFTQQFAGRWANFMTIAHSAQPANSFSNVAMDGARVREPHLFGPRAENTSVVARRFRAAAGPAPKGIFSIILNVVGPEGENSGLVDCEYLTAEGIEPNPPVRYHVLLCAALGKPPDIAPSIYTLEGAPEWLLANVADAKGPDFAPGRSTRAMLLFQSKIAATPAEALSLLPATDPVNVLILENAAIAPMESNLPGKSCPITSAGSDHVVVQCDSERAGWLVLRDNYFPGWIATVDGVETPIEIANFSFRAVPVPAGSHVVAFAYRPTSFRIGLALSLIGLLACAGVSLGQLRKNRAVLRRETVSTV